ncbi:MULTISPECIES: Crp/Fnr family transcriptional regulator [unclassified Flavobacterium]|uniref:Crp/Fnr family transcriptional regulator n=1 Tax=unclassified Flavobacterium TaxID=196869 RepID=UPI00129172AB|nr:MULTISPECIES: Crp/Fnr family transcriptional regulator [unclassified Flavobacterium]MQP53013.1 cyclic nucleotide-binding domain-containing protein [Flavobacterium sp. LMO9]MQP62834.1 cyclic nucleotide-binding domain-containing protein [Flavobacterium sp. LMO6]
MNNSIWFFDNIDVFQILCPHKFKEFEKDHSFNFFKKGDYIYFEDDLANKVFLVNSGKIKIGYLTEDGEEIITSILSKGQIFGEKAILGEEKRNEFAQALDNEVSLCVVSLDMMYELLRKNTEFSISIYKFIGYRFKKLERRLQIMLFKDAKTRLLEFLKELSEEHGFKNAVSGDTVIKHPFTQKEIASLISLSRPTLNILINELQNDKVLSFERKQIILFKK